MDQNTLILGLIDKGMAGTIIAFLLLLAGLGHFIYKEMKANRIAKEEREEKRQKQHTEEVKFLQENLRDIGSLLKKNDERTDNAIRLGVYAHERLDKKFKENVSDTIKKTIVVDEND